MKVAVQLLFDAMTVLRCALEDDTLVVEFLPNHIFTRTARQRIDLVGRLASAFDNAATSLALKSAADARGSASAKSGSPVGVRIL